MKPPPDAALGQKTAARASKAAARAAAKGGNKKGAKSSESSAAASSADGGAQDTASARRFTSPGGFTVLVGRNNKQNDILSTKVGWGGCACRLSRPDGMHMANRRAYAWVYSSQK